MIGLALAIAGGVVVAKKAFGLVDDFTRASIADGSKTVHLSRAGSYVGYYEARAEQTRRRPAHWCGS